MDRAEEKPSWQVTPAKVEEAVQKVIQLSRPLKLILFGSYVSGQIDRNSDLDLLVIVRDEIGDPRKESVRIRRGLRSISMPMDILVVPQSMWEVLKEEPGLIYQEAARHGRIVYESG